MNEKSSDAMMRGGLRSTFCAPTTSAQIEAANSASDGALMVGLKIGRKSRRARAPKLSPTPLTMRTSDCSTSSINLDGERAHGAPETGDWGITL